MIKLKPGKLAKFKKEDKQRAKLGKHSVLRVRVDAARQREEIEKQRGKRSKKK